MACARRAGQPPAHGPRRTATCSTLPLAWRYRANAGCGRGTCSAARGGNGELGSCTWSGRGGGGGHLLMRSRPRLRNAHSTARRAYARYGEIGDGVGWGQVDGRRPHNFPIADRAAVRIYGHVPGSFGVSPCVPPSRVPLCRLVCPRASPLRVLFVVGGLPVPAVVPVIVPPAVASAVLRPRARPSCRRLCRPPSPCSSLLPSSVPLLVPPAVASAVLRPLARPPTGCERLGDVQGDAWMDKGRQEGRGGGHRGGHRGGHQGGLP